MATTAEREQPMMSGAATMRARLFGLDVESAMPIAGVTSEPSPPGEQPRPVRLTRSTRETVLSGWRDDGVRLLRQIRAHDGRRTAATWRQPDGRTVMIGRGFGAFRLDETVSSIECAPVHGRADWRWQRYLIGQVLPLAAVMHGLETLHAGAIECDGEAVAIAGPSYAGKSTTVAAWLARGAPLVADDVIALDIAQGVVRVNPGPGVLSVRPNTAELLNGSMGGIGQRIGTDVFGSRLAVRRHSDPLPLGAVVLLRRTSRLTTRVQARRDPRPNPRLLLGSAFVLAIQTPERLERMLEICQTIAARVPVIQARAPIEVPPGRIVDAIQRELERSR